MPSLSAASICVSLLDSINSRNLVAEAHILRHLPDSEILARAALEAKKRDRPQSLHTTTVNLADDSDRKLPKPGR